jgi:hypothetical protein
MLVSSDAQESCSAWAAQIVMQPSERLPTLSASANASHLFTMFRQDFIGGYYSE